MSPLPFSISIARRFYLVVLFFMFKNSVPSEASTRGINPDDINEATRLLKAERSRVSMIKNPEEKIQKMFDLGLWVEANETLNASRPSTSMKLLRAEWFYLNQRFQQSLRLVDSILNTNHNNQNALLLKAQLWIEFWKLKNAEDILLEMISHKQKSDRPYYLLGNAYILEGKLKEAAEIAQLLSKNFPESELSSLLQGRLYLLNNSPVKADSIFKIGLMKNPLSADLRFYFGYTAWRNAQKGFLSNMENQWDLCLTIHPTHFLAHWHLGNGHTNKTYSDYSRADDFKIKLELANFDSLLIQKKYGMARKLTETVREKYPLSVLPMLYKASSFYMEHLDPIQNKDLNYILDKNLDSAEQLFSNILTLIPHYGPAHNGIAAVIKERSLPLLYFFDSLNRVIAQEPKERETFSKVVIPELTNYPEFTQKIILRQFYAAKAFLPILAKGGYNFHIMPLHHTLAQTFKDPYFNQSSTFDHRQWMDIRGVGSGAVGIEYVQKGAYFERNVLLHEFMHLVHATLITESDRRKIRKLYFSAIKKGNVLDYYAAANEDEYFAQIYPAYFSNEAVQPMDFKSYNTIAKLKSKDPEAYHFIDSLVKATQEYALGAQNIFKDEWCELYIHKVAAMDVRSSSGKKLAFSYLDTASNWNKDYVPLLLAKADLSIKTGELELAEIAIKRAKNLNPSFSGIFIKNYALNKALGETGLLDYNSSYTLQRSDLLKAISLESDPVILTEYIMALSQFYVSNAQIPEAIATLRPLSEYTDHGSSYQKEERNRSISNLALLKASLGYDDLASELKKIYSENTQDYSMVLLYAEFLYRTKKVDQAIQILEKGFEEQSVSGIHNPAFNIYLSYLQAINGNIPNARKTHISAIADTSLIGVRYYMALGELSKAESLLKSIPLAHDLLVKSQTNEVWGDFALQKNNSTEAIQRFEQALSENPYNFSVAEKLNALYFRLGKLSNARGLINRLHSLFIQAGPILHF